MQKLEEVLARYWGYSNFRPLQKEIIQSVLDGRDTLALLPTGGGKSVCFQVPGLAREGICLVISPLIALMKDQVANLKSKGVAAEAIYSGMRRQDIDRILENAANGAYKLLYLSPERLKTDLARARIERMNVNLLAVDEAHCISQWGYDFRPPYLEIAEIRKALPKVPVLALTATATADVVTDIQDKLGFSQHLVFQKSFERDNLSYSVLYEPDKDAKMLEILRRVGGTSIVYVRNRGQTKEKAEFIRKKGISADFYHAGLEPNDRSKKQEMWMSGQTRVVVSTNAFGMGIDKPDVRTVIHLGLPETLEAYFQEAGRAGRDGKKSYAILLHDNADSDRLRILLEASFPDMPTLRRTYQALCNYTKLAIGAGIGETFDFDIKQFCHNFNLPIGLTHTSLQVLEREGWIAISEASSIPAKVQILLDREKLYDYQQKNVKADKLIKALLRLHVGIALEPCEVSSLQIAQIMGTEALEVRKMLQFLHQENVIFYSPEKNMPQLTLTKERVAVENLTIDQEKYQWRKKRAEEKLEAAIHYAETKNVCRNALLLDYFGEKADKKCGICDVCTGRHGVEMEAPEIETFIKKIQMLLRYEKLELPKILEGFKPAQHPKVAKTLDVLLQEGKIIQDSKGKISWVPTK